MWSDLGLNNDKPGIIDKIKFVFEEIDSSYPEKDYQKQKITIGRDATNDCMIPNKTISNYHAKVYYKKKQWWIEDLNSSNGTYINEVMLKKPTTITDGEKIQCGEIIFRIYFSDDEEILL